MKYSLGSTLANAFLCPYEKKWLDSYPVEFKPKFKQSFVMFQSRDYVKKLKLTKTLKLINRNTEKKSF